MVDGANGHRNPVGPADRFDEARFCFNCSILDERFMVTPPAT
jgi:hypothetical protein